ncbi:MAG: ester cyclase [candidate division Zixibacteria bacterium]|nr:ester cyclase [candidate division Zixibacteria bacterium]
MQGHRAIRDYIAEIVTAFPDVHYTLEDLIADGDRVV